MLAPALGWLLMNRSPNELKEAIEAYQNGFIFGRNIRAIYDYNVLVISEQETKISLVCDDARFNTRIQLTLLLINTDDGYLIRSTNVDLSKKLDEYSKYLDRWE